MAQGFFDLEILPLCLTSLFVPSLTLNMALSYQSASTGSYASLLQALKPAKRVEPPRKRRKIGDSTEDFNRLVKQETQESSNSANGDTFDDQSEPEHHLSDPEEDVASEEDEAVADEDDSEDDEVQSDPFEQHFSIPPVAELQRRISARSEAKANQITSSATTDLRKTWIPFTAEQHQANHPKHVDRAQLKRRLVSKGSGLLKQLSKGESDIASAVFSYQDVVIANRSVQNAGNLRDICVLHSLNHSMKTRDRVLKNTAKLAQSDDGELELRDQGYTRPKILIVLPTKQSCVRFVESIVHFSEPEQQENKSRFQDTFSRDDTEEWLEKAEDFRELFGGNHEEDFRIGLKFTRKTIKYFAGFYNSDIILCSPLGLFRTINAGPSKDEKKAADADFLSSIEIAIVDHASSLQMQNWDHVESVFAHLNALPKDSHGCDFSRVRHWYLDGLAKHVRQTIILSSFLTPEINALVSNHLHNTAGRVKYTPTYEGVMLDVPNRLPIPVTQTFVRFDSPSPLKDSDARLKYFCATVLPQLVRDKTSKGVLVYVPTYADFTRLRNHLANAPGSTSIAFGSISEYTSVKDTARARSYLLSGRNSITLYTERAHHHFRYKIKGVQKVIFYGLPENPVFWSEVVGYLGINRDLLEGTAAGGKGVVRAMFSKWDVLKLERVVGSERVKRLISERHGDTFDFV